MDCSVRNAGDYSAGPRPPRPGPRATSSSGNTAQSVTSSPDRMGRVTGSAATVSANTTAVPQCDYPLPL